MDNKQIFAKNLQRIMAQKGKSRVDVCSDLGFSYYTFSDWINAKKYPRIDKIEMLALYFGVQKSDLIEEKPTAQDDGLPEVMNQGQLDRMKKSQLKLIELAKKLPEEEVELLLRQAELLIQMMESINGDAQK
jgi:transcriptional regulator with XRE-family HTH domain